MIFSWKIARWPFDDGFNPVNAWWLSELSRLSIEEMPAKGSICMTMPREATSWLVWVWLNGNFSAGRQFKAPWWKPMIRWRRLCRTGIPGNQLSNWLVNLWPFAPGLPAASSPGIQNRFNGALGQHRGRTAYRKKAFVLHRSQSGGCLGHLGGIAATARRIHLRRPPMGDAARNPGPHSNIQCVSGYRYRTASRRTLDPIYPGTIVNSQSSLPSRTMAQAPSFVRCPVELYGTTADRLPIRSPPDTGIVDPVGCSLVNLLHISQ